MDELIKLPYTLSTVQSLHIANVQPNQPFIRFPLTYCWRNNISLLLKLFQRLFKAEVVRFNLQAFKLSKLSVELAVTLTQSLVFSISAGLHLYLPAYLRPEFENCNIAVITDCGWAQSISLASCSTKMAYQSLEINESLGIQSTVCTVPH